MTHCDRFSSHNNMVIVTSRRHHEDVLTEKFSGISREQCESFALADFQTGDSSIIIIIIAITIVIFHYNGKRFPDLYLRIADCDVVMASCTRLFNSHCSPCILSTIRSMRNVTLLMSIYGIRQSKCVLLCSLLGSKV